MNVRTNIFTFLFFLFLMIDCAIKIQEIDFSSREFTIDEFKKEIFNNTQNLKTFVGNGDILFESIEKIEKVKAEVYIKFPDSIMVKLEGPFGLDLAYIFMSESELKYYNIREKIKYTGKYNPGYLKELTGTRLKFVEIMELLSGKLIPDIINSEKKARVLKRNDEYILIAKTNDGFEEYFIDRKNWQIKKYIMLDNNEKIILEKSFEKFVKIENFSVPRIARYMIPGKQQITLIYKKIKINNRIDPSKFYFEIPENVKEINL